VAAARAVGGQYLAALLGAVSAVSAAAPPLGDARRRWVDLGPRPEGAGHVLRAYLRGVEGGWPEAVRSAMPCGYVRT
jgi:hypothetical protein